MTSPRFTDDDQDDWTDPNLTEPKLQDEMNRRLGLNRRSRQRPRAAYGMKSAPDQQAAQRSRQTELTQIRYFKYIPYRGMSEPEKQKYLSLGPARLTSSRTAPPQVKTAAESTAAASFWPSANRAKSLKVYDYHLAELSLTYRSPPSLLDQPRRQLATPSVSPRQAQQSQQQAVPTSHRRPLFFQLHSSRAIPASAPSATQQELRQAAGHPPAPAEVAEKTVQVSRGNTPFIDSALSDYPTEPQDVVSKSDSNRLLNVVSVDECHVRHRRRRRRMRRVQRPELTGARADGDGGGEAWELEMGEDEEEEYDEADEQEGELHSADQTGAEDSAKPAVDAHAEPAVAAVENEDARPELIVQLEQPAEAPAVVAPAVPSRPTTERSGGGRKKRRTEKEMRQIAAAKFLRRNEILREKMAIYLDWKLNQERMGLIELRLGDPASRFERFTVELVQQEALVANQYRDGAGGGSGDAARISQESPELLEIQRDSATNQLRSSSLHANAGSQPRHELNLTEMYEALNA